MKTFLPFILSTAIFGTIGVVIRPIELASSKRAFWSSLIGSIFLSIILLLMKKRIHFTFIFRHAGILLLSAIALSGNWIFLYQSYDYTSISNATLPYYFAPVFVLLLAPFLLKEAWTVKKVLCIIIALFGMILIVGASFNSIMDEQLGLLYGFAAAAFYATLMLVNKFIPEIDKLELTVIQLTLAAIVLGIYVSLTDGFRIAMLNTQTFPFIFILGVVNTGIGFWLFSIGMDGLKGQSIAMLSYVDPLVAIVIFVWLLHEPMTIAQLMGAVLLLSSTLISELKFKKRI